MESIEIMVSWKQMKSKMFFLCQKVCVDWCFFIFQLRLAFRKMNYVEIWFMFYRASMERIFDTVRCGMGSSALINRYRIFHKIFNYHRLLLIFCYLIFYFDDLFFKIPIPQKELILKLAEIGWMFLKIKNYVDAGSGLNNCAKGLIVQVFSFY